MAAKLWYVAYFSAQPDDEEALRLDSPGAVWNCATANVNFVAFPTREGQERFFAKHADAFRRLDLKIVDQPVSASWIDDCAC